MSVTPTYMFLEFGQSSILRKILLSHWHNYFLTTNDKSLLDKHITITALKGYYNFLEFNQLLL